MPRVKLESQPKYEFVFETTIQKVDLNYAGHLGNDALLRMLQTARIELFQNRGYKELDLGDGKTGIIIGDLVVNHKGVVFLPSAFESTPVGKLVGYPVDIVQTGG